MKPEVIYRGIKIDYDTLQTFKFYGVDLVPPKAPIINEEGKKIVGDGNEYGLYMTDHKVVAEAYKKLELNDGVELSKDVSYGNAKRWVRVPKIGILYEISTNGIEVHKPWITGYLKGLKNNGMGGEEWIADLVPPQNYKITDVRIGMDNLHDEEVIDISDITKVDEIIKQKMEGRKQRLEDFHQFLSNIPLQQRLSFDGIDEQIFKDIFGENGVRYVASSDITISNAKDYVKYLMAEFYQQSPEQIDFTILRYIVGKRGFLSDTDSVEKLTELIQNDIMANDKKRQEFIQKKQQAGEVINTSGFDSREEMYKKVMGVLKSKQESLTQTPQQLYEQAWHDRKKYADAMEELMVNRGQYSEVEYNQRLTKLMQSRDAAQKTMDKYFHQVSKKSFPQAKQQPNQQTSNPMSYDDAMYEKYGYEDMTDEERIEFDEKLEKAKKPKVESSSTKEELISEKQEILRHGWKKKLEEMKQNGFEVPDLDEILRQQQLNEIQRQQLEQAESIERTGRTFR